MDARKRDHAGSVRTVPITRENPLELLEFDEIGALVRYVGDRKTREAITERVALLTTQGRALGYTVRGYVQEPTKDTVPVRDLFPRRICLRVATKSHVGMVLGDHAYDRGAWANRIGESEAGVGYLFGEGIREPLRVRAAWVPDDAIKDLERLRHRPGAGPARHDPAVPDARPAARRRCRMTAPTLAPGGNHELMTAAAEEAGVCVRPLAVRRTDNATGESRAIGIRCGTTRAEACKPCAERNRAVRMDQAREGWHMTEEPDLPAIVRATPDEPRRVRSTRRRQDVPDLPSVPMRDTTIGRGYSTPDGKVYRPSTFATLTMPSYGRVHGDGVTGRPGQLRLPARRPRRDPLRRARGPVLAEPPPCVRVAGPVLRRCRTATTPRPAPARRDPGHHAPRPAPPGRRRHLPPGLVARLRPRGIRPQRATRVEGPTRAPTSTPTPANRCAPGTTPWPPSTPTRTPSPRTSSASANAASTSRASSPAPRAPAAA